MSAVAIGFGHTCAVTTAGGLKCWGRNDWGQLGDGTFTPRLTPADVSGLTSGVVGVIAGFAHTCALTTAGGLKCWGRNIDGQIGDGTTVTRPTAVDVTGLTSGVAGVATGNAHTCALTTIGGLKCWGSNNRGQLGDGTTVMRTTPVNVTGLTSGVATVSALFEHTCALTSVGGVKCWGRNSHGQIGDGTFANRLIPVDVTGLTSGVDAVSAGGVHNCAITAGGGIKCWGSNTSGQLGDGTTTNRTTPVGVVGIGVGWQ